MKDAGWNCCEKTDTCRQNIETGIQLRSKIETILNVLQQYASGCFSPAASLACLFEHSVRWK
jgi:hypothetical protein